MEYAIFFILSVLLAVLIFLSYKERKKLEKEKIESLREIVKLKEIKEEIVKEREELNKLPEDLEERKNTYNKELEDYYTNKKEKIDLELEVYSKEKEREQEEDIKSLEELFTRKHLFYLKQYDEQKQSLNNIKEDIDKYKRNQHAIIELYKKAQEEKEKVDFYKLRLPQTALDDLKVYRSIESLISGKNDLNKIIWKACYEKSFNELVSRILKNSTGKLVGIYKITDLDTGKVYVGQSVDLKERIKSHIKTGIGIDFKNNLLYSAMKKTDLTNFTFEIIEYCKREELNEKEKFWINYFESDIYGFNMNAGGSKSQ